MTNSEMQAKLAQRILGQEIEVEHQGELYTIFEEDTDELIWLLPVNAIPMGYETWNGVEVPYYSDQDVVEFVPDPELVA